MRNPFGWSYPPGAAEDPRAPWNEKDPEIYECEECEGTGRLADPDNNFGDIKCECCKGTGEVEEWSDEYE